MSKDKKVGRAVPKDFGFDDSDDPLEKTPAEKAADAEDDYDVDDPPAKAKSKPKVAKPKEGKSSKRPTAITYALPDNRKLTNKDKSNLKEWRGKNHTKMLDVFLQRQRDEARKKFGHNAVYLGSEAETLVIGIPCPAPSFEFVIGQDCFPLGLVVQIVAKHGVGKSGLLAEIGRWFDLVGGGMVLCENETKFNEHWYKSIMGMSVFERMQLHRCKSVENWQEHLTWSIKKMQDDMLGTKKDPGPGKTFPVLYGVDSIMGKMSRENQEKVMGKEGKNGKLGTTGDGFANPRSFPVEAGSITKYLRTIPQLLDEWPFSLVLINHLRIKQDDMGNKERNKTGGEQVNFQESFELELSKVGGHAKKIVCSDYEGIPLMLSCEKNSFGPTGRKIQTRLLWWHELDEDTGVQVQKSVWDWDWSTVHMLNDILTGTGSHVSTYLRSRLKAIDFHLEIESSGDSDNSAWSKSLGMTQKDAITWSEVGAMIREDKKLLQEVRDALGIAHRPLLAGDYMQQKETLAEELP